MRKPDDLHAESVKYNSQGQRPWGTGRNDLFEPRRGDRYRNARRSERVTFVARPACYRKRFRSKAVPRTEALPPSLNED